MKKKSIIFIFSLGVTLVFLSAAWVAYTPDAPAPRRHKMVVFVHGTIFHPPSVPTFMKAISTARRDKISLVNAYKQEHRRRSYMKQQIVGTRGLHRLPGGDDETYVGSLVSTFIRHCKEMYSDMFATYHMYSFGWNGRLNGANRKRWGERLYNALKHEVRMLAKRYKHDDIELDIITHSHGGNVALNMACAAQKDRDNQLKVDNLIFLGVPVQPETASYITSPLFKQVYNVYSEKDMVQVLDIISTGELFSRRQFSAYEKNLPAHVKEVRVTVDDLDPGHIELWFMGGGELSKKLFRRSFPLYPYPLLVYVPHIVKALQGHTGNNPFVHLSLERVGGTWSCHVQPNNFEVL